MKYFLLILFLIGFVAVTTQEIDAKCAGPYPCRAPGAAPLSAEIWFRSDIIVLGVSIGILDGQDVLGGYDRDNPKNPCGLVAQNSGYAENIESFLNDTEHKAPFVYEFEVEKYYKNEKQDNTIHIVGLELIREPYAEQFSHGYKITPELGEKLLLHLRYYDEFDFGKCTIHDVYLVDELQGSIWGWNEDDFKPDIYPGDVKIPSLKEQLNELRFENGDSIAPSMLDLIACPLGLEPMYRLYHGGTPFCVTSDTADKIEERGWAKRFSYFWTFDGVWYKDTENFEQWR